MAGEGAPPFSKIVSSSSNGKQDESGNGEQKRIIELSEIIVREVRGNNWREKSSEEKITIFRE
ncbi:hypothetical protein EJB05_15695, partial [Eragrostis curvula]